MLLPKNTYLCPVIMDLKQARLMKTSRFYVGALAALMLVSGCSTKQGTGSLIGAGGGAVLGGIVGNLIGKDTKGTMIGAAIGGVVGTAAGAAIGKHMDKVQAEVAQEVGNATVTQVTDANGLQAVKVTFDSGLLFNLNESTLSSSSKNDLAKFAMVLKGNGQLSIDVQGYTDRSGGDGINVPLSQKRANAVADYLKSCGVSAAQFKNVMGYGSQNEIEDKKVSQANRRVEVYLYASEEMINAANAGQLG